MMKTLIVLNGPMGVGKTTVGKELCRRLTPSIFLDGDWCWDLHPFSVTDATKALVVAMPVIFDQGNIINIPLALSLE